MHLTLEDVLHGYDPTRPLAEAETIPRDWYIDPRVAELERRSVFGGTWQYVCSTDQLREPGDFVTSNIAGEPVVVVRDKEGRVRAFFNVCRHHAAEVATGPCGHVPSLRCPYHGWTYGLDGQLKGAPEFDGVLNFDKSANGLVPIRVETWEQFVFVCLQPDGSSLCAHLGDMAPRVSLLGLSNLRFVERRTYDFACNWKVYVDNYLDGGYHIPHIHKGLGSVLEYAEYTIENKDRFCLQASPMASGADGQTAAVRKGDNAYYYWLFPNFMLNWYEGYMDVNYVLPLSLDRTRVTFDFFFSEQTRNESAESVAVASRIQDEDVDICESVQRGLRSSAYNTGRLSVRREAGEQHFHRLLFGFLAGGVEPRAQRGAGP